MIKVGKLKTTISIPFLLLSLSLSLGNTAVSSTQVQKATECFEAYFKSLQQGSEREAAAFWNRKEVERYEVFDWQWEELIFRKLDVRYLNYRITGAEDKGDHVVLDIEWYYHEEETEPLQKDRRFFIQEDGKMRGANPILVHTRNWLKRESRHFVYHFNTPKDEPEKALLDEMDEFYDEVVGLLNLEYADMIDYYKCDSTSEVGKLFDAGGSLARSRSGNRVIASVRKSAPHEVVHVISYTILPPGEHQIPPEYLNEGLAYYLGGASFFSPQLLLSWAKEKIEQDESVLLDSLIRNPWIYGVNQGAGLVSSLVKFLIDTKGLGEFKRLFTLGPNYDKQKEAIEILFPTGISEAQNQWEKFVLEMHLPEISLNEPVSCRTVCYFEDPKADDTGDGDYLYPGDERALPGIFDLRGFRLSVDDEMVYFQLYFSNLSHLKISSEEGFNGTFATVVVDTDDVPGRGNTRLFLDNGNVEFAEQDGYEFAVELSNAGVLIYDHNWVWRALFLKAQSLKAHIGENEMFFAIPQQVIGIPEENWKIQVLTGGQKGGYSNITYGVGRFMKVEESPSTDQGGGGTDTDFNPDVYDILTPPDWDQVRILSNYDERERKKVMVPMIRISQR